MRELLPGLWEVDEIGDFVHCYLWCWQAGATLIDTGTPGSAPRILAGLQQIGLQPQQLQRIIITHADTDHMGGLSALRRTVRAPVACHTVEKRLLEQPTLRPTAPTLAGRAIHLLLRATALLPALRARPVRPDQLLVDGQQLPEGFTVVHTPGHTPGHISLFHAAGRFLITGDALTNRRGRLAGPAPLMTPDPFNADRSVWKLARKYGKESDAALFGHGPPILNGAGERIQAYAQQLFAAGPAESASSHAP